MDLLPNNYAPHTMHIAADPFLSQAHQNESQKEDFYVPYVQLHRTSTSTIFVSLRFSMWLSSKYLMSVDQLVEHGMNDET
jgi:hypothetical protein